MRIASLTAVLFTLVAAVLLLSVPIDGHGEDPGLGPDTAKAPSIASGGADGWQMPPIDEVGSFGQAPTTQLGALQDGRVHFDEALALQGFPTQDDEEGQAAKCAEFASPVARPASQDHCTKQGPPTDTASASPRADAQPAASTSGAGPQTPFELAERHAIETPQSWGPHVPFDGPTPNAVLRLHSWGDVAAMDAEGNTLWTRGSTSFYEDWDEPPTEGVPFIHFGTSPSNPFLAVTERPYALGDLTGDAVEDVAVAHRIPLSSEDRFAITVLDGTSGATLWTELFDGFTSQVFLDGSRLLVAEEGTGGSQSALHAYDLTLENTSLSGQRAWSYSSGLTEARWLALEPIEGDRVALSLTDQRFGEPGDAGRVDAVRIHGPGAGTSDWTVSMEGYPRFMRADANTGQLVVHEQMDPTGQHELTGTQQESWRYALVGLDASGQTTNRIVREDAMLVSLTIGDVTQDGESEWIVGDLEIDAPPATVLGSSTIEQARVIVADPATGQEMWTQQPQTDGEGLPIVYGLLPSDAGLLAATRNPADASTDLHHFDGSTGNERWSITGDALFPLFLESYAVNGEEVVLGGTENSKMRAFTVDAGKLVRDAPPLAYIHDVAVHDVGGQGEHLIAGTGSGGVLALPADGLGTVPEIRWRASIDGPVRTVEVLDIDGDGTMNVLVVASNLVVVLDVDTGAIQTEIPITDGYVWTATATDLTGDGAKEILVPTSALTAYDADGNQLWSHRPSALADEGLDALDPLIHSVFFLEPMEVYFSNVVASEGRVMAQYSVDPPTTYLGTRTIQILVGLDAVSGAIVWQDANAFPANIPRFWHSTTLLPGQGIDGGDAVGFVYDDYSSGRGWRAAALAYDIGTGLRIWDQGPAPFGGIVNQGSFELDGDLYRVHSTLLTRHSENGIDQIGIPSSVKTLGWETFGSHGEALVASTLTEVQLYSPTIDWAEPEDHLPQPHRWGRDDNMFLGSYHVEDLFDDETPQIVAHSFDWGSWAKVGTFEGVFSGLNVKYPHSLIVLDTVPTDAG